MATTAISSSTETLQNQPTRHGGLHSPPESHKAKLDSDSELSDLDEDDLIDVEPDHYADEGRVPVFKPTMEAFKDFTKFVRASMSNRQISVS